MWSEGKNNFKKKTIDEEVHDYKKIEDRIEKIVEEMAGFRKAGDGRNSEAQKRKDYRQRITDSLLDAYGIPKDRIKISYTNEDSRKTGYAGRYLPLTLGPTRTGSIEITKSKTSSPARVLAHELLHAKNYMDRGETWEDFRQHFLDQKPHEDYHEWREHPGAAELVEDSRFLEQVIKNIIANREAGKKEPAKK